MTVQAALSPRRRPPVRWMLGGGAMAAIPVLLVAGVVIWAVSGPGPAASALIGSLGVVVALTAGGLGFAAMLQAPALAGLLAALLAFALPMALLVLLFVALKDADWFDLPAFGIGMLATALAFQVGALIGFLRSRTLAGTEGSAS